MAIAGNTGMFTAFALDADTPALLRKRAVEALGRQLDYSRDSLVLRKYGVAFLPRTNRMGRYVLRVVDFCVDASRETCGHAASDSYFEWAFFKKSPNLSN